jgi:hypothetical protein
MDRNRVSRAMDGLGWVLGQLKGIQALVNSGRDVRGPDRHADGIADLFFHLEIQLEDIVTELEIAMGQKEP